MKRKGLVVALFSAMFLLMSATGFAMEIGIKGGVHMPQGDYGDLVDMGYMVGGQLKMPASDTLSWGVHLGYGMASGDFLGVDVDSTVIELYPFVDYYVSRTDKADVFLRGGLGFNMWEAEADSHYYGLSMSEDGTDIMIAAGGGVNFMKNFEAVALYNHVFGDFDDAYLTFTIGYNFDLKR